MKERDPRELAQELLEQADETRRLIARFSDDSDAWRAKALLAALKNDQAILEALGLLLGRPTEAATSPAVAATKEAPAASGVLLDPPPLAALEAANGVAAPGVVDGTRARAIVEEFDNRDHTFERGLEKLNSWVAGGRGALPFQKREQHAYLNRTANSDAMIARIESELMGREGFARRLGTLKVEGLEGDILVYEKAQ